MADLTNIEWCDSTFNPWIGCTKVGPGCDHCYAEKSTPSRTMGVMWGPHAERKRTSPGNWAKPRAGARAHAAFARAHGRRRRVFCASLADVFDNAVPQAWRDDLFDLIAATPHLDWLLVTKRIGNVGNMLPVPFSFDEHFPNVWLGITVVNQAEADRDIPKLLAIEARVRFLSIEPMLGSIDLGLSTPCDHSRRSCEDVGCWRALSWVIAGGESGPHARPSHPDWYRSLRDQCAAAGVPFLFKQWGEYTAHAVEPDGYAAHLSCIDREGRECALSRGDQARAKGEGWWFLPPWPGRGTWGPDGIPASVMEVRRVGKKAAGRLLDGVEHNGMPEVTP
jgi:protein gp37